MAGTMSKADLVADLVASLMDAAEVFQADPTDTTAFERHLQAAAEDFHRVRPRKRIGAPITLVADQRVYAAPADFVGIAQSFWGISPKPRAQPWDPDWPGPLPRASAVEGVTQILLHPAPTATQIALLGATFEFVYLARHVIGDTAIATSVAAVDRGLLLVRAQAEAMKELAIRNAKKPVALRDGLSGAPANGTPSALYAALMKEFEARQC